MALICLLLWIGASRVQRRLEAERTQLSIETSAMRTTLDRERADRISAEGRLQSLESFLGRAEDILGGSFATVSQTALRHNSEVFNRMAEASFGTLLAKADAVLDQKRGQVDEALTPIRETLGRAEEDLRRLELARQDAYAQLNSQVEGLRSVTEQVRDQVYGLQTALRVPQVRGRWGELTLRRSVELAGLVEHCDFDEQPSVPQQPTGSLRPDLRVQLPGGRSVVIDAKVPLSAFLDACEAADEASRKGHLQRHATQVREHVKALAGKQYWKQFATASDFVVLFLPGEALFSAAAQVDKELIEDALAARILIATPITLVALLRVVAACWQQAVVAENSERVAETARDLYSRVQVFAAHLSRMQQALHRTVVAFNSASASFNARLVPMAERLSRLGIPSSGTLDDLPGIDVSLEPPRVDPSEEPVA